MYDEAKKILEDAQKQADKLIAEAKEKADQIRRLEQLLRRKSEKKV